ncbi:hypothetical protein [Staphylococcus gallinarum]|uniref:Uncharacterized protein n=1 Tax=Staphylococcus gallinarum TaxID=1293 RepID=A0ABQ0XYP3_STAGA|nr:hypothetical protein [Staphylococcus gallinarum]GEQ04512.1 hypothetical protein SGA02_03400 [Staphylococcus gallinarum]
MEVDDIVSEYNKDKNYKEVFKMKRLVKKAIQYIVLNVIYSIARRILDDRKKK